MRHQRLTHARKEAHVHGLPLGRSGQHKCGHGAAHTGQGTHRKRGVHMPASRCTPGLCLAQKRRMKDAHDKGTRSNLPPCAACRCSVKAGKRSHPRQGAIQGSYLQNQRLFGNLARTMQGWRAPQCCSCSQVLHSAAPNPAVLHACAPSGLAPSACSTRCLRCTAPHAASSSLRRAAVRAAAADCLQACVHSTGCSALQAPCMRACMHACKSHAAAGRKAAKDDRTL